jgi:cell cycle checkpoint control protein RAD9A
MVGCIVDTDSELQAHHSAATGVLKTHSLNLSPCTFLIAVVDPNSTLSRFVVPAKTLKDWIDHFALSGSTTSVPANATNPSNKYESELGWYFGEQEVRVKTWEGGGGATKKGISTEIKVDVNEFEEYYVEDPPVTLTFPMREFRVRFVKENSMWSTRSW